MTSVETIKETVLTDPLYYVDHICINPISEPCISIVMATHDRIEQTLFTLKTIADSSIKLVQVIIIDDSPPNSFIPQEMLDFSFQIDYLTVKETRDWINPCVNYNIAFQYVKAPIIVIQNAEVCHAGDVLQYVFDNCKPKQYIVFDVASCKIPKDNRRLYNMETFNYQNAASLASRRKFKWYQHSQIIPRNYHFLSAIHSEDFAELEGFDYDFALDRCFDDNEFIYRIMNVHKLKIIHPKGIMGIHQYHERVMMGCTDEEYKKSTRRNKLLYQRKVAKHKMLEERNSRLVY